MAINEWDSGDDDFARFALAMRQLNQRQEAVLGLRDDPLKVVPRLPEEPSPAPPVGPVEDPSYAGRLLRGWAKYVEPAPVASQTLGGLQVGQAATGRMLGAVPGFRDAYSRAKALNMEMVPAPEEEYWQGTRESPWVELQKTPGIGEVVAEAALPGQRSPIVQAVKTLGGLVGNIYTDPINYAYGIGLISKAKAAGLTAIKGAGAAEKLFQAVRVARITKGMERAAPAVERASQAIARLEEAKAAGVGLGKTAAGEIEGAIKAAKEAKAAIPKAIEEEAFRAFPESLEQAGRARTAWEAAKAGFAGPLAGAVYLPQTAIGVGAGVEQGVRGAAAGDWEQAAGGALQTAGMGLMGVPLYRGIRSELGRRTDRTLKAGLDKKVAKGEISQGTADFILEADRNRLTPTEEAVKRMEEARRSAEQRSADLAADAARTAEAEAQQPTPEQTAATQGPPAAAEVVVRPEAQTEVPAEPPLAETPTGEATPPAAAPAPTPKPTETPAPAAPPARMSEREAVLKKIRAILRPERRETPEFEADPKWIARAEAELKQAADSYYPLQKDEAKVVAYLDDYGRALRDRIKAQAEIMRGAKPTEAPKAAPEAPPKAPSEPAPPVVEREPPPATPPRPAEAPVARQVTPETPPELSALAGRQREAEALPPIGEFETLPPPPGKPPAAEVPAPRTPINLPPAVAESAVKFAEIRTPDNAFDELKRQSDSLKRNLDLSQEDSDRVRNAGLARFRDLMASLVASSSKHRPLIRDDIFDAYQRAYDHMEAEALRVATPEKAAPYRIPAARPGPEDEAPKAPATGPRLPPEAEVHLARVMTRVETAALRRGATPGGAEAAGRAAQETARGKYVQRLTRQRAKEEAARVEKERAAREAVVRNRAREEPQVAPVQAPVKRVAREVRGEIEEALTPRDEREAKAYSLRVRQRVYNANRTAGKSKADAREAAIAAGNEAVGRYLVRAQRGRAKERAQREAAVAGPMRRGEDWAKTEAARQYVAKREGEEAAVRAAALEKEKQERAGKPPAEPEKVKVSTRKSVLTEAENERAKAVESEVQKPDKESAFRDDPELAQRLRTYLADRDVEYKKSKEKQAEHETKLASKRLDPDEIAKLPAKRAAAAREERETLKAQIKAEVERRLQRETASRKALASWDPNVDVPITDVHRSRALRMLNDKKAAVRHGEKKEDAIERLAGTIARAEALTESTEDLYTLIKHDAATAKIERLEAASAKARDAAETAARDRISAKYKDADRKPTDQAMARMVQTSPEVKALSTVVTRSEAEVKARSRIQRETGATGAELERLVAASPEVGRAATPEALQLIALRRFTRSVTAGAERGGRMTDPMFAEAHSRAMSEAVSRWQPETGVKGLWKLFNHAFRLESGNLRRRRKAEAAVMVSEAELRPLEGEEAASIEQHRKLTPRDYEDPAILKAQEENVFSGWRIPSPEGEPSVVKGEVSKMADLLRRQQILQLARVQKRTDKGKEGQYVFGNPKDPESLARAKHAWAYWIHLQSGGDGKAWRDYYAKGDKDAATKYSRWARAITDAVFDANQKIYESKMGAAQKAAAEASGVSRVARRLRRLGKVSDQTIAGRDPAVLVDEFIAPALRLAARIRALKPKATEIGPLEFELEQLARRLGYGIDTKSSPGPKDYGGQKAAWWAHKAAQELFDIWSKVSSPTQGRLEGGAIEGLLRAAGVTVEPRKQAFPQEAGKPVKKFKTISPQDLQRSRLALKNAILEHVQKFREQGTLSKENVDQSLASREAIAKIGLIAARGDGSEGSGLGRNLAAVLGRIQETRAGLADGSITPERAWRVVEPGSEVKAFTIEKIAHNAMHALFGDVVPGTRKRFEDLYDEFARKPAGELAVTEAKGLGPWSVPGVTGGRKPGHFRFMTSTGEAVRGMVQAGVGGQPLAPGKLARLLARQEQGLPVISFHIEGPPQRTAVAGLRQAMAELASAARSDFRKVVYITIPRRLGLDRRALAADAGLVHISETSGGPGGRDVYRSVSDAKLMEMLGIEAEQLRDVANIGPGASRTEGGLPRGGFLAPQEVRYTGADLEVAAALAHDLLAAHKTPGQIVGAMVRKFGEGIRASARGIMDLVQRAMRRMRAALGRETVEDVITTATESARIEASVVGESRIYGFDASKPFEKWTDEEKSAFIDRARPAWNDATPIEGTGVRAVDLYGVATFDSKARAILKEYAGLKQLARATEWIVNKLANLSSSPEKQQGHGSFYPGLATAGLHLSPSQHFFGMPETTHTNPAMTMFVASHARRIAEQRVQNRVEGTAFDADLAMAHAFAEHHMNTLIHEIAHGKGIKDGTQEHADAMGAILEELKGDGTYYKMRDEIVSALRANGDQELKALYRTQKHLSDMYKDRGKQELSAEEIDAYLQGRAGGGELRERGGGANRAEPGAAEGGPRPGVEGRVRSEADLQEGRGEPTTVDEAAAALRGGRPEGAKRSPAVEGMAIRWRRGSPVDPDEWVNKNLNRLADDAAKRLVDAAKGRGGPSVGDFGALSAGMSPDEIAMRANAKPRGGTKVLAPDGTEIKVYDSPINLTKYKDIASPEFLAGFHRYMELDGQLKAREDRRMTWSEQDREFLEFMDIHTEEEALQAAKRGEMPGYMQALLARKLMASKMYNLDAAEREFFSARIGMSAERKKAAEFRKDAARADVERTMAILFAGGKGSAEDMARGLQRMKMEARRLDPQGALESDFVSSLVARRVPKKVAHALLGMFQSARTTGDWTAFRQAFRLALGNPGKFRWYLEAWKAGMLHYPSQTANIASNTGMVMLDQFETVAAGIADLLRVSTVGGQRERYVGEVAQSMRGLVRSFKEAGIGFVSDMKGAILARPRDYSRVMNSSPMDEMFASEAIPGRIGEILRFPFRSMEAADLFFKQILRTSSYYKQAYRMIKQGKLQVNPGETMNHAVDRIGDTLSKIARDPADAVLKGLWTKQLETMVKVANAHAVRGTFQGAPGPVTRRLIDTLREYPALQLLFPFTRTPINVTREAILRTPLGLYDVAKKLVEAKKTKQWGEAEEAIARNAMGTAIGALFFWLASNDYVEGGGEKDPKLRTAKESYGPTPYSLRASKAPDAAYWNYGRIEPFASIIGSAADASEAWKRGDLRNTNTALFKVFGILTQNYLNKTFYQGLNSLFEFLKDPERSATKVGLQLAGSAIPNIVGPVPFGSFARAIDDDVRSVAGWGDVMKAKIPYLSRTLPAKRTPTGEALTRHGSTLFRLFSPVYMSPAKQGAAADVGREMDRLQFAVGPPAEQIRVGKAKVPLTRQEHDAMVAAHQAATLAMARKLQTRSYQNAPDDELDPRYEIPMSDGSRRKTKRQLMQNVYRDYHDVVLDRIRASIRSRAVGERERMRKALWGMEQASPTPQVAERQ